MYDKADDLVESFDGIWQAVVDRKVENTVTGNDMPWLNNLYEKMEEFRKDVASVAADVKSLCVYDGI